MKKPEHIKMAKAIGEDSWELLNFIQLPKNASKEKQIEALKSDLNWMKNHLYTIEHSIDELCKLIEEADTT